MKPDIRLLIVDDNIVTRYALRRRLECHGYRIDEAGTGGEGLELIASQTYDALILDVHLPDMSGFDIVRILRATPATALLPVIHVSAAAIGTGDIITGLDAGADAYLIHPVDPDVLLAALARTRVGGISRGGTPAHADRHLPPGCRRRCPHRPRNRRLRGLARPRLASTGTTAPRRPRAGVDRNFRRIRVPSVTR